MFLLLPMSLVFVYQKVLIWIWSRDNRNLHLSIDASSLKMLADKHGPVLLVVHQGIIFNENTRVQP